MNNQATHGILAPATSSQQESSGWDRCGGRNPACPTNNPDDQTSSLGTSGKLAVDCSARNPAAFSRTSQYIDCADRGLTITETAKETGASISAVKTFAWRYPEIKFTGQYGPRGSKQ